MGENTSNFQIKSGGSTLFFRKDDNSLYQTMYNTEKEESGLIDFRCFQLSVAGIESGHGSGITSAYTNLPYKMILTDATETESSFRATFLHEETGLEVVVEYIKIEEANGFRCRTSITNTGNDVHHITHLSSANVCGIATNGLLSGYHKDKVIVHYFIQTWEGEGQYRYGSPEELGIYWNSVHPNASAFTLSSVGSWSSGKYQPLIFIEDIEKGIIYYAQIEISSNWNIELSNAGSWSNTNSGLCLELNGLDEKTGGFIKQLRPGETFTSAPVFFGCCNGSTNEAIAFLTAYRRDLLKPKRGSDWIQPVFFNDYMNCLWGNPTAEKLVPLIKAAAQVGMEGFCIDAGWYTPKGSNWIMLGDWHPSEERFGKDGLQGIIDFIKREGMIPGLWLEMEMCSESSELYNMPNHWFIIKNNKRFGGNNRVVLNFSVQEVRSYIHEVIDRLYDMGVRYIKNDHNLCVDGGDDCCDSSGEGLLLNTLAFYSFIDEVRHNHKDLILENCASGAMRQDYGILRYFDLQSISDQEIYTLMPSILTGQLASILPEQLGVWAYPYPQIYTNRDNEEFIFNENYQKQMEDGEQTIFNMVTGLCGNLYLSGRVDLADEKNFSLIQQAIEVYKTKRTFIHNSFPYYINGFTRIENQDTFAAIALCSKKVPEVLIYVWRLSSFEPTCTLHLEFLKGKNISINRIYPIEEQYEGITRWNKNKGTVTVYLPKQRTARIFEMIMD